MSQGPQAVRDKVKIKLKVIWKNPPVWPRTLEKLVGVKREKRGFPAWVVARLQPRQVATVGGGPGTPQLPLPLLLSAPAGLAHFPITVST